MSCEEPSNTALVTSASALVSGATGFLGSCLTSYLLKAGFQVRVLVRPGRDYQELLKKGVEVIIGDLADEKSLRQAVDGQRFVFHTAGKVTDWGQREEFFRVNLNGTIRLLTACREASVQRLIHISSLTVLGLPRDGAVVNEETTAARPAQDPYSASKRAAELYLLKARTKPGPEITIIRPGVIWGKGDVTIMPRIAQLLRKGRMVYIGRAENRLALSHVDNLCAGIIKAATNSAAAGQIYHMTDGEDISARMAIHAIAEAMGVPKPRHTFPFPLVYSVAAMLEWAARLTGRRTPPILTRYAVRLVACDSRYDIDKARRELGYQPEKTFQEGIAELELSGEAP